jgi:hypothetical protein
MYMLTESAVTIFSRGKPHTFDRSDIDHETWAEVMDCLHHEAWGEAVDLLSPTKQVENFFEACGNVVVRDGQVLYNGEPIDSYATRKVLEFAREGLPFMPLLKFIDRVMQNPSYRAVQELYAFLEAGQLPLTPEGMFLAYKKVRKTEDGRYVDIHSGKFDNSPGVTVSMPRNMVDENPDRTCSAGLHVCSHSYLPHFGRGVWDVVVVVEVDPADVVAVPTDYDNAKMRVCKYRVLHELEGYKEDRNIFEDEPLWSDDENENEQETPAGEWIYRDEDESIRPQHENALVQVKLREGSIGPVVTADIWYWGINGHAGDIVAYRYV